MIDLTPQQIVAELDKYIVGQHKAKRCVAVALRNRYRRQNLKQNDIQDEIMPKNIIMIGATGVGKTEIARRLAKLVKAPFIKVEATKFTEVGYVGRDVESMVRDLVETSVSMIKNEKMLEVEDKAKKMAEIRLAEIILPEPKLKQKLANPFMNLFGEAPEQPVEEVDQEKELSRKENLKKQREELVEKIAAGEMQDEEVEIEVEQKNNMGMDMLSMPGMEGMGNNLQDMFDSLVPKKHKKRRMSVKEALKILTHEEAQKLIDMDDAINQGVKRAEQDGIIFLDEIDKVAGRGGGNSPDVSRGGVQRDILPIVEGSTVITKYGPVKTDYVLFIAAGAFSMSKPSDLIPELQGRFPIRVELDNLGMEDFRRILLEPKNSLIKQYQALLESDGVDIEFTIDGIEALANIADYVNLRTENIGARRLHTVLEKVLEDLLYEAPDQISGHIEIDNKYVEKKLSDLASDDDLSRFIL